MTLGGWIMMGLSVGGVTIFFAWSIWKALTTPEEADKIHGFEMETPDIKASRESRMK